MDADGIVFFRGSISVSQYFGGVHLGYVDDSLWGERIFSDADFFSAAESASDPCLSSDHVGGIVLHASLEGGRAKAQPETGKKAETDRVLHPFWGVCSADCCRGECGEDLPDGLKKFRENGE